MRPGEFQWAARHQWRRSSPVLSRWRSHYWICWVCLLPQAVGASTGVCEESRIHQFLPHFLLCDVRSFHDSAGCASLQAYKAVPEALIAPFPGLFGGAWVPWQIFSASIWQKPLCTLQDYSSVTSDVMASAPVSVLPYPQLWQPGYNVSVVFAYYGTGLVEVFQEHSESVCTFFFHFSLCRGTSFFASTGIVAGGQSGHHCQCGLRISASCPFPFLLS